MDTLIHARMARSLLPWLLMAAAHAQAPVPGPAPGSSPTPPSTTGQRPAAPQAREAGLRTLRYQREDEDWRWLANGALIHDPWDRIKRLPTGNAGTLALGADSRAWYEHYAHENWGSTAFQQNGYLQTRVLAHADWRSTGRVRVFTQLKAVDVHGRNGGARTSIDRNRLDLHQLFAEVDFSRGNTSRQLRIGRQELAFGKMRVISTRDGAINGRQSEEGLRWIARHGPWRIDVFAVRVVAALPGTFDDDSTGQPVWTGVYATRGAGGPSGIDVYALGFDAPRTSYFSGAGDEHRRMAGVRRWWRSGAWDHEVEALVQFGHFGNATIRAWSASLESGVTFDRIRFAPRIGIAATLNSGDRRPSDRELNTYRPLQSRTPFGTLPAFGVANAQGVQLLASAALRPTLRATVRNYWLWRESIADGLYSGGGVPLRAAGSSGARRIGAQLEAELEYTIGRHARFGLVASHLTAGDFIRAAPGARDIDYVAASVAYRF